VLKVLATPIRQGKEIRNRKEKIKLTLFTHHMSIEIRRLMEYARKF
jgi:hypothetical protein